MKIHLLIDHTALLVDDKKTTVTVEPETAGVLEIEGGRYPVVASGETVFHPIRNLVGHVRVAFVTETGARYVGIKPFMNNGIPVTSVDVAAEYAKIRIHVDSLERQIDKLTSEFHAMSAENKRDALGFLTKNTKHTEVES